MRKDQRAPSLTALERAQAAAYPPGEYVGQESFMRAGEVRHWLTWPGSAAASRCSTCAAGWPVLAG